MLLMSMWNWVEAKRGRVSKKKKSKGGNITYALMFVGAIFCLTFVPLVFYFLYNVWNDPLSPTLVKNGTELLKEKTMGFLSRKKQAAAEEKDE
jgi:hypothetical protein